MTLNGLLDIFMFKKYSLKKSFYIQQEYHFKMPVRESVAEQRKETTLTERRGAWRQRSAAFPAAGRGSSQVEFRSPNTCLLCLPVSRVHTLGQGWGARK